MHCKPKTTNIPYKSKSTGCCRGLFSAKFNKFASLFFITLFVSTISMPLLAMVSSDQNHMFENHCSENHTDQNHSRQKSTPHSKDKNHQPCGNCCNCICCPGHFVALESFINPSICANNTITNSHFFMPAKIFSSDFIAGVFRPPQA